MSVLARVASALGLSSRAPKLSAANRARAVPDLSLWYQGGRIGGDLTPRKVSNIIRAADTGWTMQLMDLANECRQKDCHLSAVLSVGEESLASLPWQLVLPEDAREKDRRAAKFVEERLRGTIGFRRLLSCLAGAPYYGFDVNEIVWTKEDGKIVPKSFDHLAHRRFGFRPSDGQLVLRDPWMDSEGVDFRNEWPDKFVVSQPRINGDSPHREGLCRVLVWATLFRTWTIADWLKTAELSWKPWRIGTYKAGSSASEDRADLEDVLDRLTTTGWAAKSDAVDIDIEWPAGTQSAKSTHSELVNVLAQEMSKAYLGQTETVQASSSSGYGQAKVHDIVRKDIREARANQTADDVTRDVVAPMIEMNYGATVVVPRFEFVTDDSIDLAAFALSMLNLTKSGLVIPQKWARETAGIPEPEDDEDTFGGSSEIPIDEAPEEDANGTPVPVDDAKPAKKPKPKG